MNNKFSKILLSSLLAVFVFGLIFVSLFTFINFNTYAPTLSKTQKVHAQLIVSDPPLEATVIQQNVAEKGKWWKDAWIYLRDKVLVRTAKIAYKNALRNFLGQMAQKTATWLASGNSGKEPLFTTESWKDFQTGIVETTIVDTLDILSSDNGFFEFNVCQPSDLNFAFSLQYTQFKTPTSTAAGGIHKAKCDFQDMKKSWTDFRNTLAKSYGSTAAFTETMSNAFEPTQQNVGIKLKIDQSITSRIQDKKTQQFLQRLENQGLSPITSPITKAIKTPAKIVGNQAATLPANAAVSESTPTGDIVADAMGIFTNTLMSKLMERWLKDATGGQGNNPSGSNSPFVPPPGAPTTPLSPGQNNTENQFAGLAATNPLGNGTIAITESIATCSNSKQPSSKECVVEPEFLSALEQELTVGQALEKNYLHGNYVVGWQAGTGSQDQRQPGYLNGYSYRSLVILRTHRIIPASWELAAWYAKLNNKTVTLDWLVHCFEEPNHPDDPFYPEDCVDNALGTSSYPGYNPYYHLVDPNWVLKSPETYCAKIGYGYEEVGGENDYSCDEDNVSCTCPETDITNCCKPEELICPGITTTCGTSEAATKTPVDQSPNCEAKFNPDKPVRLIARNGEYCADWQTCLKEDDSGGCKENYGYCLKEKEFWRFPGESCKAEFASCQTLTRADGRQFSFLTDTLSTCEQNEIGCGWYATEQEREGPPTSTLAWKTDLADSRIYLNQAAQSCELSDAGCTKVGKMVPGQNILVNGDFEKLGENNNSANWQAWHVDPNNSAPSSNCTEIDLPDEAVGVNSQRSLKIASTNGAMCGAISDLIPIDNRFTYILSGSIKVIEELTTLQDVRVDIGAEFFNEDGILIPGVQYWILDAGISASLEPTTNWQTFSGYLPGDSAFIPPTAKYVKIVPTVNNFGIPPDSSRTVYFDNIQLGIAYSPVVSDNPDNFVYNVAQYNVDYGRSSHAAYSQHLKVAPDYLGCQGYNDILFGYANEDLCFASNHYWRGDIGFCVMSGDRSCENYATYCKDEEIGCQGYTPAGGGPEVPAKTAPEDVCPSECVGYESYLEQPSSFAVSECPGYDTVDVCLSKTGCVWNNGNCLAASSQQMFIPASGQSCSAQEAGCEEFSNLDELSKGGEGTEYFTSLRQCISQNNPNLGYYYTWEGSDTTGYQLKKWEFLQSNHADFSFGVYGQSPVTEIDKAPCTNIEIGQEECTDSNQIFVYDPNNLNPYSSFLNPPKVCLPVDIENGEFDCRDFFDALGNHFYRRQSYAVTASTECHPYRRTLTNQIYNADPAQGTSCSADVNGCREYKGNAGNNVRVVPIAFGLIGVSDNFESGTVGDWTNSDGVMAGLEWSNEAVVQGGHSLKVFVTDNIVRHGLTGELSSSKQYQLSFWGKKTTISNCLAKAATPGTAYPDTATLNFSAALTYIWSYVEAGPIYPTSGSGGQITISISDLGACDAFYLDNIILTEYNNNIFAVKDSWNTPVACDNNIDNPKGQVICTGSAGPCTVNQNGTDYTCTVPTGATSCVAAENLRFNIGAQEGCLKYADRQNTSQFLKKFSYICSDTAIGCEAFISTQNSTIYQGEHTYGSFICDEAVGEIINDVCYIRGEEKCVLGGQTSCTYQGTTVSRDEIVYLVNDPEKSCSAAKQGCTFLGKPALNKQLGDLANEDYVTDVSPIMLLNNPDNYAGSLCSASGEFCAKYTESSGSQSPYYYLDPVSSENAADNQTCLYNAAQNKWLKSGSTTAECPGNYSAANGNYLARQNDADYTGWVGLCEAADSSCEEYRDPELPLSTLSTINQAEECDALIAPQLHGVYTTSTLGVSYGEVNINGLTHKVCTVAPGQNSCEYSAYDWTCQLSTTVNALTPCCIGGNTAECDDNEASEFKVCNVASGFDYCSYTLLCDSYYYKADTLPAENNCSTVNRASGCRLFNDANLATTTLFWNSDNTLNNAAPAACTGGLGVNQSECDANSLIQVRKDRACAEWLECGSGYQTLSGEEICLGLIKCSGDPGGNKTCVNTSGADARPLTADLTPFTSLPDAENYLPGADSIRLLSGYSHAGAAWSQNIKVDGYFSPAEMSQSGDAIGVLNGGFEEGLSEQVPNNWRATYPSSPEMIGWWMNGDVCTFSLDTENVQSGQYSLKLTLGGDYINSGNDCVFTGFGQNGGFYAIDPNKEYNLSFYAKSSSGAQKATIGLWFFNNGASVGNPGTSPSILLPITPFSTKWSKYTITYVPSDTSGTLPIGTYKMPANATQARIYVFGPTVNLPFNNNASPGTIWYDNFAIEPVLSVKSDGWSTMDCQAFPKEDSPACNYRETMQYNGLNNYCLEPDPFTSYNPDPLTPNNTQSCLQWYPMDVVNGSNSGLINAGGSSINYTGPSPLYFCAQSSGNNKFSYLDMKTNFINGVNGSVGDPCVDGESSIITTDMAGDNININEIDRISVAIDAYSSCSNRGLLDNIQQTLGQNPSWGSATSTVWWHATNNPCFGATGDGVATAVCGTQYPDFISFANSMNGCGYSSYDTTNAFVAKAEFDSQGKLMAFKHRYCDGGSGQGGGIVKFRVYLKESCNVIVKVVNNLNDQKVWLSRYNNGWTVADSNILGYSKEMNYGGFSTSINGGSQQAVVYYGGTYASNSNYIGNSLGSYLSSPPPLSIARDPGTFYVSGGRGRVCINGPVAGQQCDVSNADNGDVTMPPSGNWDCTKNGSNQSGICGGIGLYCFNQYGYTNGQKCSLISGVSSCSGTYNLCQAIGHTNDLNPLTTDNLHMDKTSAIDHIQQLFAKVYEVWEWEDGSYVDKTTDYNSLDITNTGSPVEISHTQVLVSTDDKIVTLKFNTNVVDNQLPIRQIKIVWDDENNSTSASTTLSNLSINEQPNDPPHTFTHQYTNNGTYRIRFNVKDNWGWCWDQTHVGDGDCDVTSNGTTTLDFSIP